MAYHYSIPQSKGEVILDETRLVSAGEVVVYNLTEHLLTDIMGWAMNYPPVLVTIKSLIGNLTLFLGCYSTSVSDLELNYTELCSQEPTPINTNSFSDYIGVSYFIILVFGMPDIYHIRLVVQR